MRTAGGGSDNNRRCCGYNRCDGAPGELAECGGTRKKWNGAPVRHSILGCYTPIFSGNLERWVPRGEYSSRAPRAVDPPAPLDAVTRVHWPGVYSGRLGRIIGDHGAWLRSVLTI